MINAKYMETHGKTNEEFYCLNMVMVLWNRLAQGLNEVARSKPKINQLVNNFVNNYLQQNWDC